MEEKLKEQQPKLPVTYKEALIQLLEEIEKNEILEAENKVLLSKADYHDEVLNKENLLSTTIIAKDLGMTATKLHQKMNNNKIIYKNKQGVWMPYKDYEWLVSEKYAD